MAADTYISIGGLYHLQFQAVSVALGGIDMGDYVVDVTGACNVPFGADDGGIVTAAYLSSLSPYAGENAADAYFDDGSGAKWYTVPCVVGQPYTSRGQPLRAASQDDLKSPSGPALGKPRRTYEVGALLQDCITGKIKFGTDFAATLAAASLRTVYTDPSTEIDQATMFSGVYWAPVNGPSNFDSVVSWQVNRPVPATVNSVTSFIEGEER